MTLNLSWHEVYFPLPSASEKATLPESNEQEEWLSQEGEEQEKLFHPCSNLPALAKRHSKCLALWFEFETPAQAGALVTILWTPGS